MGERASIKKAVCERVCCLLKGIAEGTYNTKHAEAARLYYTTILLCYSTTTLPQVVATSSGTGTGERVRGQKI